MKVLLVTVAAAVAAFAQQQPEITQTPTDVTIRYNVQGGVQPGMIAGKSTVRFIGAMPIGGNPIKGSPYSAEAVTETAQTLADGNRIQQRSSSMQYRDGLGRERREETFSMMTGAFSDRTQKLVIISDPVAGANYSLNPQQHTAEKMGGLIKGRGNATDLQFRDQEIKEIRAAGARLDAVAAGISVNPKMILNGQPPAEAPKTEDLGSQMIEGVLAKGTRTTVRIPSGQIGNTAPIEIVDETWYSSDLQMNVMTRHSDPRMGETVYKLTNIQRTEPDPALFQVPADYKITEGPKLITTPGVPKE